MEGNIEYAYKGGVIIVRLDNRIVGAIKPDKDGYRYHPVKSSISGEWFKTIGEVQKSLHE